ncbi:MAG TPA: Hsp20/alpha crystallin family protein [Trueperaceae bacterium]|nr:Hsp20/alpha crystallin family protein [Trueperaceae bacterium]
MSIEKFGTAGDIQELIAVRDHIEALVEQANAEQANLPKADFLDRGDAFQLHLEVPGIDQADLEIAVEDDELLVAGLREPPLVDGHMLFSERSVGPFQRSFVLPSPVDRERATAHLASGVLTVTLPKLVES